VNYLIFDNGYASVWYVNKQEETKYSELIDLYSALCM